MGQCDPSGCSSIAAQVSRKRLPGSTSDSCRPLQRHRCRSIPDSRPALSRLPLWLQVQLLYRPQATWLFLSPGAVFCESSFHLFSQLRQFALCNLHVRLGRTIRKRSRERPVLCSACASGQCRIWPEDEHSLHRQWNADGHFRRRPG